MLLLFLVKIFFILIYVNKNSILQLYINQIHESMQSKIILYNKILKI